MMVIFVIGVLAGIAIVSYGAWRTRTAQNEVSSDLNSYAAAMESARNFGVGYPATTPTSFTASPNVTIFLKTSTSTAYCVQATSTVVSTVVYHVAGPNRAVVAGACP